MTKKHFIQLAQTIKDNRSLFSDEAIEKLSHFCQQQNAQFNKTRWMSFIEGDCGPNGGRASTE